MREAMFVAALVAAMVVVDAKIRPNSPGGGMADVRQGGNTGGM